MKKFATVIQGVFRLPVSSSACDTSTAAIALFPPTLVPIAGGSGSAAYAIFESGTTVTLNVGTGKRMASDTAQLGLALQELPSDRFVPRSEMGLEWSVGCVLVTTDNPITWESTSARGLTPGAVFYRGRSLAPHSLKPSPGGPAAVPVAVSTCG